jgi:hypothetical protein
MQDPSTLSLNEVVEVQIEAADIVPVIVIVYVLIWALVLVDHDTTLLFSSKVINAIDYPTDEVATVIEYFMSLFEQSVESSLN